MTDTQNPITQNEVASAAAALQASNTKVTILAVREKLGRGSFTTVKKFLDRWQSSSETQHQAPPVPPQLESLWIEARRVADANLAAERESISALALELDTRLKDMEVARIETENARLTSDTRFADKTAELERTQVILEDLQRQRDHFQSRLESSEAALLQERASWTTNLSEVSEQLARLNESQVIIQNQGLMLAETVQISGTALLREIADFIVNESNARVWSAQKLCVQIETLLQPVTGISPRLAEVDRQLRKLHRQQVTKGYRSRSK